MTHPFKRGTLERVIARFLARTLGELLLARWRPLKHVVGEEPLQGIVKGREPPPI